MWRSHQHNYAAKMGVRHVITGDTAYTYVMRFPTTTKDRDIIAAFERMELLPGWRTTHIEIFDARKSYRTWTP